MMKRYSNENTDDYFRGDRYLTGDLGKIVDNRLYIIGRKKDLIVKGGMNISPKQIEDCIISTGLVTECVVAGIVLNDEENIICWYTAEDGASLKLETINNVIEEKIGRHCRVDHFRPVSEIPKNLNGKADKRKLVEESVL